MNSTLQNFIIIVGGLLMASISLGAIALVIWSWYRKMRARRHAAHHTTGVNPPPVVPTPTTPTPTPAPATTPVVPVAPTVAPTTSTPSKWWATVQKILGTVLPWIIAITVAMGILAVMDSYNVGFSTLFEKITNEKTEKAVDSMKNVLSDNIGTDSFFGIFLILVFLTSVLWIWQKLADKTKKIPIISPLTFSFIGAGVMALLGWIFNSYFKHKANEFGFNSLIDIVPTAYVLNFFFTILVVSLWTQMWRGGSKDEGADKKDSKDKTSPTKNGAPTEVQDGHVAVLEFMGIPLKFFLLSEGRLWLPPLFGIKERDVRKTTLEIPLTAAEKGIKVMSRDNEEIWMRVSVSKQIDKNRIYEAIFEMTEKAIEDGIRDSIVHTLRFEGAKHDVSNLLKANSAERERVVDALRLAITPDAERLCTIIYPDTLKIPTASLVSEKANEAREKTRITQDENAAVKMYTEKFDERVDELYRKFTGTQPAPAPLPAQFDSTAMDKAVAQARIDFKVTKHQTIEMPGGKSRAMVNITP